MGGRWWWYWTSGRRTWLRAGDTTLATTLRLPLLRRLPLSPMNQSAPSLSRAPTKSTRGQLIVLLLAVMSAECPLSSHPVLLHELPIPTNCFSLPHDQ